MEDYLIPPLKETPCHIILHVGKNDVPTKKGPAQIIENIVNLAIKLKRNCDVSISGIKVRNVGEPEEPRRCISEVKRRVWRNKFTILKPLEYYNCKTPKRFKAPRK